MTDMKKPFDTIIDYLAGAEIPNVGAEMNRQAVARFLVEKKGWDKNDVTAGVEIVLDVAGEVYRSRLDLVVGVGETLLMVIKCVAGSPGSREREVLASARLLDRQRQVPISVVSDGKTAIVLDTISGERLGVGMDTIPSKASALADRKVQGPISLEPLRREREKIIFRSYDMDNVNRLQNA